ncbi:MAG: cation diffusion facilitator family transporter, partial [Pollutimonas bauzanensis]
ASSRSVIYVALAGNLLVAASKFIAAAWTGSSAMLSEGVHSVVDTANELLLLYGIHRSAARPDRAHPLGYGREIYFWSFIVGLLILTFGAGVSVYEGIIHIRHPHPIENPLVTYLVLAAAALFEGTSWVFTLRRFKGDKRYAELFQLIVHSKDPPTFIVLLEDSAALAGLLIAFFGVYLSVALDEPALDGAASILIGITLGLTAILVARETKGLLIGEAASARVHGSILRLAEEMDGVARANGVVALQMAPQEIIVALSVEFTDPLRVPELEAIVVALEGKIRAAHPEVSALFIKPQTLERYRESAAGHYGGQDEQAGPAD